MQPGLSCSAGVRRDVMSKWRPEFLVLRSFVRHRRVESIASEHASVTLLMTICFYPVQIIISLTFLVAIHTRGVPGKVQCTRIKHSKINYDTVMIEGIYTYIFDKTTFM